MLIGMDEDRNETTPAMESPFKHLPPRITPEQMVEVQPIVHTDNVVHHGAETEWLIRAGGGG